MALLIGQSFWLALPVALAGILHMVVVKRGWLAFLARPIDGGRTLGGAPIFGLNKTWRGIVFMTFGSAAIGALQGALGGRWAAAHGASCLDFASASLVEDYAAVNSVLGFGYALGELPNSFVKRRLSIEPGKTLRGALGAAFLLIDQADSVVAALVLGALVFPLPWAVVLTGSACLTLLHLGINLSLWLARVRINL